MDNNLINAELLMKAREKRLVGNSIDAILGNTDNLTDLEKKQAENYIRENPEIQNITEGVVNMISEGKNDVVKYLNARRIENV
ncbi:MAG: hypothetical protein K6A23_11250 [Butyrivibrio sp.]|nr:hypothetical protein [Butyrivibrio sp.]